MKDSQPYDYVVRVINKGTKIVKEPLGKPNWVGESFREFESKKMAIAGGKILSSKGTKKISLGDYLKSPIIPPRGYITTNKGTGRVKL